MVRRNFFTKELFHRGIWALLAAALLAAGLMLSLQKGIVAVAEVTAKDRYVSPSGSDLGSCNNPTSPCKTIQYAVSQSAAGDTIHITGTVTETKTTTINKTLTLKTWGSGTAELRSALDTDSAWLSINGNTTVVTLTQLVVNGNYPTNQIVEAVRVGNGARIVLDGVSFKNIGYGNSTSAPDELGRIKGTAVRLEGGTNHQMRGLRFENIGRAAIVACGANLSVRGSEFIGKGEDSLAGGTNNILDYGIVAGNRSVLSGGENTFQDMKGQYSSYTSATVWLSDGDQFCNPVGSGATGTITSTHILTSSIGISVTGGSNLTANSNRIVGDEKGIGKDGSSSVNAEHNWWGCNGGPGSAGCDTVSAGVDASNPLTLALDLHPLEVASGEAFTSTGKIQSGGYRVPDGTEAQFSGEYAVFTPDWGKLLGGMLSVSGNAMGQADGEVMRQITVTVDNQAVGKALKVKPRRQFIPLVSKNYPLWLQIFNDNSGDVNLWNIMPSTQYGTANYAGNILTLTALKKQSGVHLVAKQPPNLEQDKTYRIQVQGKKGGQDNYLGIVFLYQNDKNYFVFSIDPKNSKWYLDQKINDKWSYLRYGNYTFPDDYVTLKIEFNKNEIDLYIDDNKVNSYSGSFILANTNFGMANFTRQQVPADSFFRSFEVYLYNIP